jgi:hypothetical protein
MIAILELIKSYSILLEVKQFYNRLVEVRTKKEKREIAGDFATLTL